MLDLGFTEPMLNVRIF